MGFLFSKITAQFYWGPGWNPVTGGFTACLFSDNGRALFCY